MPTTMAFKKFSSPLVSGFKAAQGEFSCESCWGDGQGEGCRLFWNRPHPNPLPSRERVNGGTSMILLTGVDQDFHRPQKSPGAYEWWHFDGTDDKSGYSFVIQFHAGNLFSAYYQDSLRTYWEKTKSPLVTGSPAPEPPNPLDYCGVSFRLFHKGTLVAESLQEFSQKSLKASDKHGAVLLGPNRFNWDERGDPPSYVLTAQAPLHGGRTTIRARLFFTPNLKYSPTLPQPDIPSTHTWVLAAPLCHVEGTFEWVDHEGESGRIVPFVGKGYHDHHFGSVPLGRFVKSWHWGRVFLGNKTLVYSFQWPADGKEAPQGILFFSDREKESFVTRDFSFKILKASHNFFWLPYHRSLEVSEIPSIPGSSLKINHQILGDGPVSLILKNDVIWTVNDSAILNQGLSNYIYTPRLSNRLFYPLLKGKSLIIKSSTTADPPPDSGDVSTTRPPV